MPEKIFRNNLEIPDRPFQKHKKEAQFSSVRRLGRP